MEEAKAEVRRVVDAEFPDGVTKVDINSSDYSSDEENISDAPGSFDVFIAFGGAGISKNAKRNWSPANGFHYVLEDYPAPAMSVGDTTWDEERRNKESAKINESETGVECVVLELKSDVKNERQPTNYVHCLPGNEKGIEANRRLRDRESTSTLDRVHRTRSL